MDSAGAARRNAMWEPWELALLTESDLDAPEVARRTGRSVKAVRSMRARMREGKRWRSTGKRRSRFAGRLLAQTCTACGTLRGPEDFSGRNKVCKECRRLERAAEYAANEELRKRNAESGRARNRDPEKIPHLRAAGRATHRRVQAETRKTASRSGYQWTGPELEIVMRDDITARAAAAMTGRTYDAVIKRRALVRQEPKWAAVAGITEVRR